MQIFSKFPESKFILIIRDSRDNIRSILDKINIPGNKETNPNMLKRLKPGWKQIFEPELFHWDCKRYIDVLCYRWNYAASISDKYKSQNIIIVKYEDFNKDKIVFIKNLANHLEEKGHGDIYQFINVPFQPRGENKHISWQEFYGEKNLHRIESLCRDIMKNYGYKKSLVGPK